MFVWSSCLRLYFVWSTIFCFVKRRQNFKRRQKIFNLVNEVKKQPKPTLESRLCHSTKKTMTLFMKQYTNYHICWCFGIVLKTVQMDMHRLLNGAQRRKTKHCFFWNTETIHDNQKTTASFSKRYIMMYRSINGAKLMYRF